MTALLEQFGYGFFFGLGFFVAEAVLKAVHH